MELSDVIKRLKMGQGIRRIHVETGVHRTIIRSLRDTAETKGWLAVESSLPTEEEVQQARRSEVPPESSAHPLETFRQQIEQWVAAGHSYVVMHQLIKDRYACSEATLRRFVQRRFPSRPRVSVARPTVAGQDMEVDFGYLGLTYDPQSRPTERRGCSPHGCATRVLHGARQSCSRRAKCSSCAMCTPSSISAGSPGARFPTI